MTQHDQRRARRASHASFACRLALVALALAVTGQAQDRGSSSPVARISVVAPPMEYFLLEATLPVPPDTYVEGASNVPLSVSVGGQLVPTQIDVVSRYPDASEGADVVDLVARVRRPSGVQPGDEFEVDVVASPQTDGQIVTTSAVQSLIATGGVRVRANDLVGNEYSTNLLSRVRTGHSTVTRPRDGRLLREYRSHEIMRPGPDSGTGHSAPYEHMFGVHVFTRTYAGENFVILDLLFHNGMFGDRPSPVDDPIHDIYFDELVLDVPTGWSIDVSVDNPMVGDEFTSDGRSRRALVSGLANGQFHVVSQQAQFVRRVVVAQDVVARDRGRAVLRRETRGFCMPGQDLWSWWNPETARYLTTNTALPTLHHLSRAGMTNAIRGDVQAHEAQLSSGAGGGYPRISPVLGWAHPWGVGYGGHAGGDEIEMFPDVDHVWARHPIALRELELRARAYIDRQPDAMFDSDGRPPIVEDHVVDRGGPSDYVPTEFFQQPTPNEDYFGFESASNRFEIIAARTGRSPDYKDDLETFRPIDFAHLTRFLNPQLGLAWLANDGIAKLQLELHGAIFHFSYHEFLNSPGGYVQGTGLRARIDEAAIEPGKGGEFGRHTGWGLIGASAYYAFANDDDRAILRPWMRQIAQTARRSQSTCTGNPSALWIPNHYGGVYRTRQSFEVAFFVNSCEAMRTTVFDGVEPATEAVLRNLIVDAAYSTVTPPFWDTARHGQVRRIAVRPAGIGRPEFCFQIPGNGFDTTTHRDHDTAMPLWTYAYRATHDRLFLQRCSEALGGNILSEFESRGLVGLESSAPIFALMQSF